ncbi:hypothetical protein CC79DRAFT_656288 [Sarocladium strictum]
MSRLVLHVRCHQKAKRHEGREGAGVPGRFLHSSARPHWANQLLVIHSAPCGPSSGTPGPGRSCPRIVPHSLPHPTHLLRQSEPHLDDAHVTNLISASVTGSEAALSTLYRTDHRASSQPRFYSLALSSQRADHLVYPP